ncbi:hypothetical protein [Suipraeoptans intestinalis]|uniref:hypothetical protein n=1 Tax=Suipraeoptans intestinalis TaxID=2606628 RepID=UPI00156549C6|nr:hypothetical protein [Suipraeoptans intestinalis]
MATKDILEAFFKAENERDWEAYQQFLHKEIVWQLFDKETRQTLWNCATISLMSFSFRIRRFPISAQSVRKSVNCQKCPVG